MSDGKLICLRILSCHIVGWTNSTLDTLCLLSILAIFISNVKLKREINAFFPCDKQKNVPEGKSLAIEKQPKEGRSLLTQKPIDK